jgi:hypothetical protein
MLLALFLIVSTASPAFELRLSECQIGVGLYSDLSETKAHFFLRIHQGAMCPIYFWKSSRDGDSLILATDPRISLPPSHGVIEVAKSAHDVISPSAPARVDGDDRAAEPHQRSFVTGLSEGLFIYRPIAGYIGHDHFVAEFDYHKGDIVVPAVIDVDIAILGGA